MESRAFSPVTLARHELEDAWRLRAEQALQKYRAATDEYRRLLREDPSGFLHDQANTLSLARDNESQALLEYSRVLRIFTDLTLHGTIPREDAAFPQRTDFDSVKFISVVDDDESIRDATKTLLKSAGYTVNTFASAEIFLESGALRDTECMVLDVRMPGMDGLELQRRLNASQSGVPIIFLTAHDDARSRRLAMDGGAVDFLCKPFDANALIASIQTAITRRNVSRGAV